MRKLAIRFLLLSLVFIGSARGDVFTWNDAATAALTGITGWNNAANWDGASFPQNAGDEAFLTADFTGALTASLNQNITLGALTLNDTGAASDSTITLQAGVAGSTLIFDNSGSGAWLYGFNGAAMTISSGVQLNDTLTITNTSGLTISGAINATGTGALIKNGSSTLTLSGNNTWNPAASQEITVNGGNLTIGSAGNNANLNGIVRINAGTFQIEDNGNATALGTATLSFGNSTTLLLRRTNVSAGVNYGNDVVADGDLIIQANNTGGAGGNSRAFRFGDLTLNGGKVQFRQNNNITLVFDGITTLNATTQIAAGLNGGESGSGVGITLNGQVTGAGGLVHGPYSAEPWASGVLWLAANNNDYAGTTTISNGVLRGQIPSGNLLLRGGVYEPTTATFTRPLGTGADEVQINGGGFGAWGQDLTVNLGGSGDTMVWGSGDFGAGTLIFNNNLTASATNLVAGNSRLIWMNGLDLNGGVRTNQVGSTSGTISGIAEIAGKITDTEPTLTGSFTKTGLGVLILSSTDNDYDGATTVSAGGLVARSLPTGNVAIAGGVFVADQTSTEGMSWTEFVANRSAGYGSGANQWRIISGGLAARGGPLSVGTDGTDSDTFNVNFTLGYALRQPDGGYFANGNVNITRDIDLTARRTITVAATGPGRLGDPTSAVRYELSGALTGAGGLTVACVNGATNGGELVLSGTLATTGNVYLPSNTQGFNTGPGGVGANAGAFLRFGNPGALPTGAPVNSTAYIAGIGNNNGAAMQQGILFDASATPYTLNPTASAEAAAYRLIVGGCAGGQWRTASFGATGTATLRADVLTLVDSVAAVGSFGVIVRGGVFTLGDGTQALRLVPVTSAGLADQGISGVANTVTDATAAHTLIKTGEGTLALGNVAYQTLAGASVTNFYWQLGRGGADNTPTAAYFDGAVRETGVTTANSLSGFNIKFQGAVLEGNDASRGTFTRSLGTGLTQVQWAQGGGGFAAQDGTFTINLGGTAASTQNWASTTSFLTANNPLILGSRTADNMVDWQNGINLNGAIREIRTINNPDSVGDVARISGRLNGNANAGIRVTGDGVLELTGNNAYTGRTIVASGTLLYNGTLVAAAAGSNVTVQAGATLGGNGTINREVVVENGGRLAPGTSPGTLTVASMTLDTMTYLWELGGSAYDSVTVNGALTFNGTPQITFALRNLDAVDPTGQIYTLFTSTGISGGYTYAFDAESANHFNTAGATVTDDGSNVYLSGLTPVPEPATLALLGLGGALAAWRRRKQV